MNAGRCTPIPLHALGAEGLNPLEKLTLILLWSRCDGGGIRLINSEMASILESTPAASARAVSGLRKKGWLTEEIVKERGADGKMMTVARVLWLKGASQ